MERMAQYPIFQEYPNTPESKFKPTSLALKPPGYSHGHLKAKDLIKACAIKGFYPTSSQGRPTVLGSTGKKNSINLAWTNHSALPLHPVVFVQLNSNFLDHQPIIKRLKYLNSRLLDQRKRLSIHPLQLYQEKCQLFLKDKLDQLPNPPQTLSAFLKK
ncbi:hypothetical protein O181_089632 [Austropuccinia psidii MF-1]|uniref:Uncharacterized protein n=1 Tax=Austropuccinia psidii MF-1 TaxID=1389203 RepID=A0A9Q3ITY1_9BASI|nr:hypothetical protein [Austropuccinia psidii MF-1]